MNRSRKGYARRTCQIRRFRDKSEGLRCRLFGHNRMRDGVYISNMMLKLKLQVNGKEEDQSGDLRM